MHTFNSGFYVLELIQMFNTYKKLINQYYNSIDNTEMKYSLIFNALGFGYINTNYQFININNINT